MYNFYLNIALFIISVICWFLVIMCRNTEYGNKSLLRKIYMSDWDDKLDIIAWVLLIINFIYLLVNLSNFYIAREFVGTYPETKLFLERGSSENKLESVSFRQEKLEVTEDLFSYQWRFEEMPNWTFVTEEIMQYEPIK